MNGAARFCLRALLLLAAAVCGAQDERAADLCGLWAGPEDSYGRSAVICFYYANGSYGAYAAGYRKSEAASGGESVADEPAQLRAARAYVLGELTYLYHLQFIAGEWKNGKIHNPVGETDFSIRVRLSADAQTAYLRVSLDRYGIFGISSTWRRLPREETGNYALLTMQQLELLHPKQFSLAEDD